MHHSRELHRLAQVERALKLGGGTHTIEDILDMIDQGSMQSFSDDDTWVVTQVLDFPRKRVLEVFMVVGSLDGMRTLEPAVMDFAKLIGANLVRAFGRNGFAPVSKGYGWSSRQCIFLREV